MRGCEWNFTETNFSLSRNSKATMRELFNCQFNELFITRCALSHSLTVCVVFFFSFIYIKTSLYHLRHRKRKYIELFFYISFFSFTPEIKKTQKLFIPCSALSRTWKAYECGMDVFLLFYIHFCCGWKISFIQFLCVIFFFFPFFGSPRKKQRMCCYPIFRLGPRSPTNDREWASSAAAATAVVAIERVCEREKEREICP